MEPVSELVHVLKESNKTCQETKSRGLSKDDPSILCDICVDVIDALSSSDTTRRKPGFRTLRVSRTSSSCSFHPELLQWLLDIHHQVAQDRDLNFAIGNEPGLSVWIVGHLSAQVQLTKSMLEHGRVGFGRICDPHWIDANIVRRWKENCDKRHDVACGHTRTSQNLPPSRPTFLIDTDRECLVPAGKCDRYIALSYVWGKAEMLLTRQDNLEELKRDRALSNGRLSSQVAYTIADAINLTKLLGEKYLWVDALCIVQDEDGSKHDLINNMSSIFASATLTIIAADGKDAWHGLRGLQNISKSRNLQQKSCTTTTGHQLITVIEQGVYHTRWSARGWTFQEALFSRRSLVFCNDSVHWNCGVSHQTEDIDFESYPRVVINDTSPLPAILNRAVPDILGMNLIVNQYSWRQFTFREDILDAFAGVTTAMAHNCIGGFLNGLPVMFLDTALLWQPFCFSSSRFQRRLPSKAQGHCPPSWSWAGWVGGVLYDSWIGATDYMRQHGNTSYFEARSITIPTVEWYIRDTKDAESHPIRYQNEWTKYRDLYAKSAGPLPDGWRRLETEGTANFTNDLLNHEVEVPKVYYVHEAHPDIEFWYPIPLRESHQELETPCSGQYISCKTQQAHFSRDWTEKPPFNFDGCRLVHYNQGYPIDPRKFPIHLRDHSGTPAGYLTVHESPPTDGGGLGDSKLEDHSYQQAYDQQSYELVAISKGRSFRFQETKICSWSTRDDSMGEFESEAYDFVNVLWVEWLDGIAYRRGIGRIFQQVWERQELEDIDLILG